MPEINLPQCLSSGSKTSIIVTQEPYDRRNRMLQEDYNPNLDSPLFNYYDVVHEPVNVDADAVSTQMIPAVIQLSYSSLLINRIKSTCVIFLIPECVKTSHYISSQGKNQTLSVCIRKLRASRSNTSAILLILLSDFITEMNLFLFSGFVVAPVVVEFTSRPRRGRYFFFLLFARANFLPSSFREQRDRVSVVKRIVVPPVSGNGFAWQMTQKAATGETEY